MRPGACLVSFFLATAAAAGTGTSTLTAQTSVNTNCSVSTTGITFGNYDPLIVHKTTNLDISTAQITITCVKGTAPTIALGLGNNASGSTRRMIDAPSGDFLNYELYQPSGVNPGDACSFPGTVWGSAGANLFSATAAPNKNSRSYRVCATVFAGQNPSVGSYADVVVVTVNF